MIEIFLQKFRPDIDPGRWKVTPLPSNQNTVWKIETESEAFLVKSHGPLARAIHSLEREREAASLASSLQLTAPIFKGSDFFVQEWIEGERAVARKEDGLQVLARLHDSGFSFSDRRQPKEMAQYYLAIGEDEEMEARFSDLADLWRMLEAGEEGMVPSHCDPILGNFLHNASGAYLIDWEYAGMAEPYWDLAIFAKGCGIAIRDHGAYLNLYARQGRRILSPYRLHLFRIALRFVAGCWASAALRMGHRDREILTLRRQALDLLL